MSKDYNFYFDETYHDKAITLSDSKLNILADNILDDYIGFFWGTREDKTPEILELFSRFETEQKAAFSMPSEKELKSRSFSNNQFKYGVKSFSSVLLDFYTKLFDACIDQKLIFQMEIISKMEILVRRLFPDREWFRRNCFVYDVFVYSFSKMLVNYNHQGLIDVLCRLDGASNEECIDVLNKTVLNIIAAGENVARKGAEVHIYKQFLPIFNCPGLTINAVGIQKWIYFANFDGLCNLLKELSINPRRINLYIDKEDNTVAAAQAYPFKLAIGVESKENIGVRVSDWLVGFIGKMIWGLIHDPQVVEEKVEDIEAIKTPDFSRRRLINSKWFELNEKQFDCYKKAARCFITQQPHKWTILHCAYADHSIQFTTLLRYIDQFDFEQYIQTDSEKHRDKYTEFCLLEMQAYYKTIEKI